MPLRPSPAEELPDREAEERPLRRGGSTGEDVPASLLERVEAAAGVERDGETRASSERAGERKPCFEERAGPGALEAKQRRNGRGQRAGEVVVGDAVALEVLLGEVDATKREVPRRVLDEIHQLEPGADGVA